MIRTKFVNRLARRAAIPTSLAEARALLAGRARRTLPGIARTAVIRTSSGAALHYEGRALVQYHRDGTVSLARHPALRADRWSAQWRANLAIRATGARIFRGGRVGDHWGGETPIGRLFGASLAPLPAWIAA